MSEQVYLGKLIEGVARRDATHVALAPAGATEDLNPGERVGLVGGKDADGYHLAGRGKAGGDFAIGIVDPFLTEPVKAGQRFWLALFPRTVTGLRHEYEHPAFAEEDRLLARAEGAVRLGGGVTRPLGDPALLTSTVRALCNQMRKSRNYAATPILADALQDAGCDDDKALADMRNPNPPWCYRANRERLVCLTLGGDLAVAARRVEELALLTGQTYHVFMEAAEVYAEDGESTHVGVNEEYGRVPTEGWAAFWLDYALITGSDKLPAERDRQHAFFSCSC